MNNSARGSDAVNAYTASVISGPGPGHNAWLMTSTLLVLFMTLPGLALFYGGLVRQKNVLSISRAMSRHCRPRVGTWDLGFSNDLPAEGIEPTRSCDHWILSPARLPVPPRRPRRTGNYKFPTGISTASVQVAVAPNIQRVFCIWSATHLFCHPERSEAESKDL